MRLQWTIHYDVAALAFIGVLLLFISKSRSLRIRQNKVFSVLCHVMLFATLLDTLTAFTLSYAEVVPLALNIALNILCLCATQILPLLLLVYLFFTLKIYDEHTKKWLKLLCVPSFPALLLIALSPITKGAFYFDEQMNYVHGPQWSLLFLPCVFVMLVSVCCILKNRRRLTALQTFSLLSFDFMIGLGMALQVFVFEWVLLTYFCMSLSLFVIYLAFQRQEYFVNRAADMFNQEAFHECYEEAQRLKCDVGFALIEMTDARRNATPYEPELNAQLYRRVNAALSARFGRDNVFILSPARFAVLFTPPLNDRLSQTLDELRLGWVIDRKRIDLSCAAAALSEREKMPEPANLDVFLEMAAMVLKEERPDAPLSLDNGGGKRLSRLMDVCRALHEALEHGTLAVYYQPICDAGTHKIVYAEALARIEDERLGVIPAAEFIDIAERDGSIVSITEQLFARVADTARALGERYPTLSRFTFNLSAAQLMQNDLVDRLLYAAHARDVPFQRFIFELTESEPITRAGQIGHNIDRLYANGANLSLDDFGTGYSNFSNIFDIPFDTVKIDKSLVCGYARGGNGFLKYLCDLFHEAGTRLIAEGIETDEQVRELTGIGCDMLQGYYFGRPMSEAQLRALLEKERAAEQKECVKSFT